MTAANEQHHDESGYPSLDGLEAIVRKREERDAATTPHVDDIPAGCWEEAVELLTDCWDQWAYEGNGGKKWHGGLSTLEWLDEFLTKIGVEHGT